MAMAHIPIVRCQGIWIITTTLTMTMPTITTSPAAIAIMLMVVLSPLGRQ